MSENTRGSGASFEALRKQAKRWLKAIRSGDRDAAERLKKILPRHSQEPGLREVQQALARELGFESWAALKEQRELSAVAEQGRDALIAEFLECACIFSSSTRLDFPQKWRRAERIRLAHPDIATASIHTAVVCGEIDHVRQLLAGDRGLVNAPGGVQRWEPLLFACYNRLPNAAATSQGLALVRLLLDSGADSNTHFIMRGEGASYQFSAVTGAMGQGEMGQPEHPQAEAIVRLLLERGARPADGQGLYNTHLVGDDTRWLELLFAYGLDNKQPMNWVENGGPVLDYLAAQAATNGHLKRLELLLRHGANPNARSVYDDKTCYEAALLTGKTAVAELLLQHGAERRELTGRDAFLGACVAGQTAEAARLLDGHPEYLESVDPLIGAVERGDLELARRLLDFGMDPNRPGKHGHYAVNVAAKSRSMSELLWSRGVDPKQLCFGGTPSHWARLGNDLEMARLHAERSRWLLDSAGSGHVALVRELVAEDPACVAQRSPRGQTALHRLPDDPDTAQPIIEILLAAGADPDARDAADKTPAQSLTDDGLDDIADLLDAR